MTPSTRLANPRRTTLARIGSSAGLTRCSGRPDCQNVAVQTVDTEHGRQPRCQACARR